MATLQNRIAELTKMFDEKRDERTKYMGLAYECLMDMQRYQEEYRVLEDIINTPEVEEPRVQVKGEAKRKEDK